MTIYATTHEAFDVTFLVGPEPVSELENLEPITIAPSSELEILESKTMPSTWRMDIVKKDDESVVFCELRNMRLVLQRDSHNRTRVVYSFTMTSKGWETIRSRGEKPGPALGALLLNNASVIIKEWIPLQLRPLNIKCDDTNVIVTADDTVSPDIYDDVEDFKPFSLEGTMYKCSN